MKENEVVIDAVSSRIGQVKNGTLLSQKCMHRPQSCSLYCPKCRIKAVTIRVSNGAVTSHFLTNCGGDFPIAEKKDSDELP